jgi:Cu-Zn family superoxide dismutase
MKMESRKPAAFARILGEDKSGIRGKVLFYSLPGGVMVEANIVGLPKNKNGFFGFHIHSGDQCSGIGFSSTGTHYDRDNHMHPRHAGDLPPLLSAGGRAYLAVVSDRFSMREILGRTVVIHDNADDFTTQPAGNAGRKIACGVIEPMNRYHR